MEINGPSGRVGIALTLLIGLASIGFGAYSYSTQSAALSSAETVEGTITSTSIEKHSTKGVSYTPQATFNYTYEGETYTASNVYPGTLAREFDTESAARAELEGYDAGDTVTVYVPTDSPAKGYLQRESSNKPFLLIGVGALFVVAGGRSALT
ncbi:DUF3592 domain-containing protein [Haloplanus aerogenes]|uniref:DUF3592 domain-containing protein n=1 Tax=Haloplanus aerogenes TaxID=660522 RepID=A0A3M0DVP7_9EURY|nr:DUF3592 domain-containing protein [Haloplanus aerogenes]AZH24483.1 DUF3592 domain-containing protein [Haloplanus aerogenes]RMB23869.1 uncharacterized protein DUF3592 [Haloplanus aerogenes]